MCDIMRLAAEETQGNYRYTFKVPTGAGLKVEIGDKKSLGIKNSLIITLTSSQGTAYRIGSLADINCNKEAMFFQYDKGDIAIIIFPKENPQMQSNQTDLIENIVHDEIQDNYRYSFKIPTSLRGIMVEAEGNNSSTHIENSLRITVTSSQRTAYKIWPLAGIDCNKNTMFFQYYKGDVTIILPKENRPLDSNKPSVSIGLRFLIK